MSEPEDLEKILRACDSPDSGDLAYDGSSEPQKRPLTARERDVLCRLISLVSRDPYYQGEEIDRLLEIRDVINPRTETA